MELDTTIKGVELFLAISGALAVIVAGVRKVYRLARNIEQVLEKVNGMEKELHPNGGSTLRDAVDRIYLTQADHSKRLAALEDGVRMNRHYAQTAVNVLGAE